MELKTGFRNTVLMPTLTWVRDLDAEQGTAVKGKHCRKELSERGTWSGMMAK